ncbi:MAG: hypothetical protein QM270_11530 [Bacillota bacterium]|nr:hypothetical protein [Bacillota bacterium]
MARKAFTPEEMEQLKESPYVLKVTPRMVNFSAAFKEKYWEGVQSGQDPREVVKELGLDPEILGDTRLDGLKQTIQRDLKAGRGFRDVTKEAGEPGFGMSDAKRIEYLEAKLAYKEQEILFLKKIASLYEKKASQ